MDHLRVDDVALFKGLVQLQLADHAAQAGLCQLRHGHDVVGRAIAGQLGVGDLKVQNAVNLQLRVVAGDANLAGHIERDFFQTVLLDHVVDKRHHKVQTRGQAGVEFAQSFDHPSLLLWHNLDGLDNEQDRDDHENGSDFHGFSPFSVL